MNIIKIIAYTIFIFITEKFKGKVPIGPIHQLFQLEPHAKTERYVVTHSIITVGISLFCYEAYINSNEETPISILIVELVKKRDLLLQHCSEPLYSDTTYYIIMYTER